MSLPPPIVRQLGVQSYADVLALMHDFTDRRGSETCDEFWLVEHPAVYTQGQAGKPEHLLHQTEIPVVQSDRGGQITYHAPGQLVLYLLLDLRRLKLGVRDLVTAIEQALIATLAEWNIEAFARSDAPGVYVARSGSIAKIASLGLRVRRGCTFHGLALNVNMDLTPFLAINPCGYAGLAMTQLSELGGASTVAAAAERLLPHLITRLGFSATH